MSVGVLSLVEFLLARIEADEQVTDRAGSFTPWSETFQNDNYGHLTIQPARVLAECEAKRRIVERCRWAEADPKAAGDMEVAGQWEDAMDNLYDLASVYADHPDYRDEWKP